MFIHIKYGVEKKNSIIEFKSVHFVIVEDVLEKVKV